MLKDLILSSTKNTIYSSEVEDPSFEGWILGYKNNTVIGFISYYNDYCVFSNNTYDDGSCILRGDNLEEVLTSLLKDKICTHFKVLEFGH